MAFIPAKDPGPHYSIAQARGQALNQAAAAGRNLLGASAPGGVIRLDAVRGIHRIPSRITARPMVRSQVVSAFGQAPSMNVPRFASTPVCGKSAPDGPPDMWPSANNLFYLKRSAMPYGRQLRGFGMLPNSPAWGDTWSGADPSLVEAAQADDVVGNGIFDGAGAPPTAHAGSGVFESRFAMPGYLYREQPTQPSEIRDTTTGMPVVYQPDAGGSWYDDTRDAYRPFDLETPRLYGRRLQGPMKMMPAVRLPALKGVGATEFNAQTAKAWGGWIALGALGALGIAVLYKAVS